jgi:hypothetical protein
MLTNFLCNDYISFYINILKVWMSLVSVTYM